MKLPVNILEGFTRWMVRSQWPDLLQLVLHEHLSEFCDRHDIDSFEEMAAVIGHHSMTTLRDIAFNDFLSRETEQGNVVDDYLKRRGLKEKAFPKAYLKGIRHSVLSLYEVVDIQPGKAVIVKDLVLGGEAIMVEEQTGSRTLRPGQQLAGWVINARGHVMISGGILPFSPAQSAELLEELQRMTDDLDRTVEEHLDDEDNQPDDEAMGLVTQAMILKTAAPLFSATWLRGIETPSVH